MQGSKRWPLATLLILAVGSVSACGGNEPEGPSGPGGIECNEDNLCALSGTYTEGLTLTADKEWLLRGGVFIGDDVNETVLEIEPGTTVLGNSGTNGMLVIRRGSKIMAEGTREKPIVFTSSKKAGSRTRGDWGGIIINGRARINCPGSATPCEAFGEGGTGFYGGNDDADSSGVLKYVRVEFAGRLISPDNELNGIAFQGVGSGTQVDYVQVHMNKDDGIEFFGGTVTWKHVITTGIADDCLDWTDGWRGKGQFYICQQYDDASDNGIEADNNGEVNDAEPRSKPTLSNLTLIGSPDSTSSDYGVLLREGTEANISNSLIVGFNGPGLNIDHTATFENAVDANQALSGNLTVTNSIIDCAAPFDDEATELFAVSDFFMTMNSGNLTATAELSDPFNQTAPGFKPMSGSPALGAGSAPSDSFFDQVDYVGAVGADDWTQGWTTSAPN